MAGGVTAAGLALLSRTAALASLGVVATTLGVVGLGVGLFTSPNNSALMGAAPRHRQGIAAAVLAAARSVGMVLGVGLSGAVFTTVLAHAGSSPAGTVAGVRASLLAAAGVAALGVVTAAVRSAGKG